MTESDYIAKLKAFWPKGCDASLETIALADDAVRAFPQSPRLWCMRGDLIQLDPENGPHSLDEARTSYERASTLDPQYVEAWVSLAHFHNAILDDEAAARKYFQEAEKWGRCHTMPRTGVTEDGAEPPPE